MVRAPSFGDGVKHCRIKERQTLRSDHRKSTWIKGFNRRCQTCSDGPASSFGTELVDPGIRGDGPIVFLQKSLVWSAACEPVFEPLGMVQELCRSLLALPSVLLAELQPLW